MEIDASSLSFDKKTKSNSSGKDKKNLFTCTESNKKLKNIIKNDG